MPYIKQDARMKFDEGLNSILEALRSQGEVSVGELNYVISSILWDIFKEKPSYTLGNNLMGVLASVKEEFYRRQLAPYEQQKIFENGDI